MGGFCSLECFVGTGSHRHFVFLRFPFSQNQHVRHFLNFSFANLGAQFVGDRIDRYAYLGSFEQGFDRSRARNEVIVHRQNANLFGCEPSREITCKMFDKKAAKSLHRSKGSAVNHDRTVLLVVRPNILEVKALR